MTRRRITFRQLETFAVVARQRSFSRAAAELHLTQPAVSLQIRQIAETLGLPLFEQHGREATLTAAGQEMLRTVRELDDVWNRFESAIADLKGLRKGSLRLAVVTTAKSFMPRMVGEFSGRYPEIAIELEIADRERVLERLRNNLDDLYVMVYPPDDVEVISHPFLDNQLVVVAPTGHWAAGRQIDLADIAGERFILREVGSGSRLTVNAHLVASGVKLDVRMSVNSNEAIRDLVASGVGLAVLSSHALAANPAADGLCVLDVRGFPLRRPWRIVHLKQKVLSLPAQAFLEQVLAYAVRLSREG